MNSTPSLSLAREPLQQRGQERFETVLAEAIRLLKQKGLSGFSIPALAERLGFTRTSIYNFFPTPYAILNELARRELLAMEAYIGKHAARRGRRSWKEQIRVTVNAATKYYEENPVGRMLLLGSSQSDETYRAQALTVQHLGRWSKWMFQESGVTLPAQPIDVMELAIELGEHCFRHSVFLHGRITPEFRDEAANVMVRYLEPYVQQSARR
jgi:AcrR family transcriptional regulator